MNELFMHAFKMASKKDTWTDMYIHVYIYIYKIYITRLVQNTMKLNTGT